MGACSAGRRLRQVPWVVCFLLADLGSCSPGVAQPICVGDCDRNLRVEISDLVLGLDTALLKTPMDACPSLDVDGNGAAAIDELIMAVENSVHGCPLPERCGDGILVEGEECDDANSFNGDGCSDACEVESLPVIDQSWLGAPAHCDRQEFEFLRFGSVVGQEFTPTRRSLVRVEVGLGGNAPESTQVRVTLRIRVSDIDGEIVGEREALTDADEARGSFLQTFEFSPPLTLSPGALYVIEVAAPGEPLVWEREEGEGSNCEPIEYPGGRPILSGRASDEPDFIFRTFAPAPADACGDERVGANEECDDGNVVEGDGCDAFCAAEPLPVVDQSWFPEESCGFILGGSDIRLEDPVGQEFVPMRNRLSAIDVQLDAELLSFVPLTLTLRVREDAIDGIVVGESQVFFQAGEAEGVFAQRFEFLPPAVLVPGTSYVIEVGSDQAGIIWERAQGSGGCERTEYPLGGPIVEGNPVDPSFDFLFRTFAPAPSPGCGDGVLAGTEKCDDGNVIDGDGCSAACTLEPIGVIDQSWPGQSDSCSEITGYVEIAPFSPIGQEFTPTSDELRAVEVGVTVLGGTPRQRTLSLLLRAGTVDGPILGAADVLIDTTLSRSELFVRFDFLPPLILTGDVVHVVQLTTAGQELKWLRASGDRDCPVTNYLRGRPIFRGEPQVDGLHPEDLVFRTYAPVE